MPPVLLKVGSTTYRMVAYYRRAPGYRRKGPPLLVLRLLGPFVVILTVEVLATGVALLYLGSSWHRTLLLLHKAGFIVWLGAMGIHVLGHLAETFKESWRDWVPVRRWRLGGAGARRTLVTGSLVLGTLLAVLLAPRIGQWR